MNPILLNFPEEIAGERILIRVFQIGDGPAVWEAIEESRAEVQKWLPWTFKHTCPDDSEEFARKARARWITREDLTLGMWKISDGRYLGGIALLRINWEVPSFEIGYWIRTSEVSNGYVTEAVSLLTRFAFETLNAKRVEIRCDTRNTRSEAVPRRLGFIHEATLRCNALDTDGVVCDTHIFALTAADWTARNPGP